MNLAGLVRDPQASLSFERGFHQPIEKAGSADPLSGHSFVAMGTCIKGGRRGTNGFLINRCGRGFAQLGKSESRYT